MRTYILTGLMVMAVSSSAGAATKEADYKALFAAAQKAHAEAIGAESLAKARLKELPAHRKKLLAVKDAIAKADAIVKDDLTRIAKLKTQLKAMPALVKKGEAAVKKDIADVKVSSGVQVRRAMFLMTLDFRGDQGRKGNLWLDANIFGVDKEIKTRWNFDDVKPAMERLGRLVGNAALAEANYKANQLGIDVGLIREAAMGTASVLKANWPVAKAFVDKGLVDGLAALDVAVDHAKAK